MLLAAFCFVFFFSMGVRFINRVHLEQMKPKCKIHAWEFYNGQMCCTTCKKTPEEVRR